MSRRSYDHYCTVSRALDLVGDRWSLLVVRELCAGPRRYSDLFADLPGISTDMLAARLKDLERDGILTRSKVGPRATTAQYELTEAGQALRPVLEALSAWGVDHLGDRRPTDAIRAHWFAIPLGPHVAKLVPDGGSVTVRVADATMHYLVNDEVVYREGPADHPDLELQLEVDQVIEVLRGRMQLTS
ncbi:winged helix-turn-helix transcriptional regulator [Smaragdicoccus niigatensis]|uniref:winged helix-turn-helix transcriptional regulator n=1 Tax=Smaragdicoccus niigatensis TaxID=359359 RepID=UPI000590C64C|nr:helix-turn-helix domain-containing protein [Smaragdicoccus niigatensis]